MSRLPTFNSTVTVLNKCSSADSESRVDEWHKTVLTNCAWSTKAQSSVNGAQVVLSASFVCRIPKSPNYLPYKEWIAKRENLTFSQGDYIVLGEVWEEITANNVVAIMRKYAPNCMQVRLFKDNTAIAMQPHYRLEGV